MCVCVCVCVCVCCVCACVWVCMYLSRGGQGALTYQMSAVDIILLSHCYVLLSAM